MEKQRRIMHSSRFANVFKLCSSVETPCLGRTDTAIQTQLRHKRPCGPDLKGVPQSLHQKMGEWVYISMLKIKIECLIYEYIRYYDSHC